MRKINLSLPKSILVIAGPTASGKSGLALEVADKYNGVIINCDSMQVYTELRIITARPSSADEAHISHKLYGAVSVEDPYSVGIWRDMAITEIEACWQNGKLPIITGGTGLYIKALMEGLTEIPKVSSEIRENVIARHNKIGVEAFHQELREFDPVSAERLNKSDSQRVIRAFEVYVATERSLSDWHKQEPTAEPLSAHYQSIIFEPPRGALYAKCEDRLDWMVENGALDEVRNLMNFNLDLGCPPMKALGVPEIIAYLNSNLTLEEALNIAKQSTRHYVKRQMTWFRNQIVQNHGVNAQYSESLLPGIFSNITL
jgi:tRNA dimethylallyltransferase